MPPKSLKKKVTKKKVNANVPLPTTPDELETVLCQFLTADNAVTAHALEILRAFLETPQSIPAMLQRVTDSPNATSRQLAAVLLCKRIKKHWRAIPPQAAEACRQAILERLVVEESVDVRRSVAALACIIARTDLPKGKWGSLLHWLWEASNSENPNHRDTCLRILRSLIESCPEVMAPHFPQLRTLFETFVGDANAKIRHRALSGLNTLFGNYDEESDINSIDQSIPPLISVMDLCIQQDDDESLGVIIDIFTQMIEAEIIDQNIHKIFTNMVAILVNTENLIGLRGQASSFITEYAKSKPGMFSKYALTEPCIDAIIATFVEADDDPFDTADTVPQRLGIEIIEVFMQYLPRTTVFNKCIAAVQAFMTHPDEHHRKAAYVLVAMLAEGTTELMAEYEGGNAFVAIINQLCLTLRQESSDLVKMAAGIALSNLAENLGDEVAEMHATVVPALLSVLETPMSEVVRRKYVLALDSCCENIGEYITPYLNGLMDQLNKQLQSPDLEVQEAAVNAISSTAISAQRGFLPFYHPVVDYLARVITAPEQEELIELKAKSICCVSSIAKAVGYENWAGKIEPLIHVVSPMCDSENYSYRDAVLCFLGNIISTLGKNTPQELVESTYDFCTAIIESVEGLHISEHDEEGANLKGFSDDEDDQQPADDDDDDVVPATGMTMDVGALDEKLSAFRTLAALIDALDDEFEPLVEDTYKTLNGVLNFPFDGVRKAVLVVLGHLLAMISRRYPNPNGIVKGVNNPLHPAAATIATGIFANFLGAAQFDEEGVVVSAAIEQILQAFHKFGMGIIPENSQTFTDTILNIVQETAPCQVQSEWNDVEAENGGDVLDSVCDLLGAMAQYMGPIMKPFYDQCLPSVIKYCSPERPDNFRSLAVGGIAEVIDFMGPVCSDYVSALFPIAIQYLQDPSIEVRRNSTYLAGVLAMNGGAEAASFLPQATELVMNLTILPEDQSKHTSTLMGCRDNAIAALAKFIISNPQTMPLAQYLPVVVQGIPLKDDVLEGAKVYPIVCQAFEIAPEVMMPLIPQVVDAFTQVFAQPSLLDETKVTMVALLKGLVSKFPAEMQNVVAALPPIQQQSFQEALSA